MCDGMNGLEVILLLIIEKKQREADMLGMPFGQLPQEATILSPAESLGEGV